MSSSVAQPTSERETFTDPVLFQRRVLKRKLWQTQERIAQAVASKRHVAVKGCHASGKTYLAAGLIPWWLTTFESGKVIQISPTLRQVKIFWDEVALAARESNIRFPEPSVTGLRVNHECYALGISSSRGVNVQGFHGDNVLIIADEAPGIEEDIWDAMEGIAAGGSVVLLELGNPTVPSGHFFDSFHRDRRAVECITISAFDSPNLAGLTYETLCQLPDEDLDKSELRYLTSRRWTRDFTRKWGLNHPKVRARVFGEFPEQATNAVFPLAWIERAEQPYDAEELDKIPAGEVIQWGLDVAGPGDDHTALCARVRDYVLMQRAWAEADPLPMILGSLGMLRRQFPRFRLGPGLVDIVGIGYHLAPRIAEQGFECYGFVAGARAMDSEHFVDAKAEGYWGFRERLERRAVRGILDRDCQAQMADLWYFEDHGRTRIESKDDMRERKPGCPSPDETEALIMAYSPIVVRQASVQYQDLDYEISPY
jgi:phage terminase large subunit